MKISANLQFDLALLWRTLDIIKDIDDSSIVSFFEQSLETLKMMPKLSLSTYWDLKYNRPKSTNLVGNCLPDENYGPRCRIMKFKDLRYLKNIDNLNILHDPLDLVHKLFETACGNINECSSEARDIVNSTCLLLSIKSGRSTLLLRTITMIASSVHEGVNIDYALVRDIYEHVRNAVFLPEFSSAVLAETSNQSIYNDPLTLYGYRVNRFGDKTTSSGNRLILSFGKADHGKLGHGDVQLHRLVPTIVEALQGVSVVKMASMSTYTVAIDSEGLVYVWGVGGSATSVAAGHNIKAEILPRHFDMLPPKAAVMDISCGLGHTLFLLKTGKVYSYGIGGNGRLGHGDCADRNEASLVIALNNHTVVSVVCGASHSLALTSQGQVYSWGKNSQGQCGVGNETLPDVHRPTLVKHKLEGVFVSQLSAGWEHSIVLSSSGKLFGWGCGYKDSRRGIIPPVLGLGNNDGKTTPEPITAVEHVVVTSVTCGWDHCLALDDKGRVLSWGSGQNGKLGQGAEDNIAVPTYIAALQAVKIVFIAAGCEHSACISEDGSMFTWGHGDGGRLGHGNNAQSFLPVQVTAMKHMNIRPSYIHCGDKFTLVLATGGSRCSTDVNERERAASTADTLVRQLDSLNYRWDQASAGSLLRDGSKEFFWSTKELLAHQFPTTDATALTNTATSAPRHIDRDQLVRSLLFMMAQSAVMAPLSAGENQVAPHLRRGADREFSVECGQEVFVHIAAMMERFAGQYCFELESFVAQHADWLGQPGQGASIAESWWVAHRSTFEPLYCILTVFAANIETTVELADAKTKKLVPGAAYADAHSSDSDDESSSGSSSGFHSVERHDEADRSSSASSRENSKVFHRTASRSRPPAHSDDLSAAEYVHRRTYSTETTADRELTSGGKDDFNTALRSRQQRDIRQLHEEERQQQSDGDVEQRRRYRSQYPDDDDENKSAYDRDFYSRDHSRYGDSNDDDDDSSLYSRDLRGNNLDHNHNNNEQYSLYSRGSRSERGYSLRGEDEYDEGSDGRSNGDYLEDSFRTRDDGDNSLDGDISGSVLRGTGSFDATEQDSNLGTFNIASPAPSCDSIEQHNQSSTGGPPRIHYVEESVGDRDFSSSSSAAAARAYEQQQRQDELDLQRAIMSSMADIDEAAGLFERQPQHHGDDDVLFESENTEKLPVNRSEIDSAAAIPRIRDTINSVASQCFIALETIGNLKLCDESDRRVFCVRSVNSVWELAQSITSKGFRALYSAADQRTVLCQVVQSPSAFLYIIPGLVSGILGSGASDEGCNVLQLVVPECHVLLCGAATRGTSESSVSLDDLAALLHFVRSEMQSSRDPANSGLQQQTFHQCDFATAMYSHVTSSLTRLFIALLVTVLNKLSVFQLENPLLLSSRSAEYGLTPNQPWGSTLHSLLSQVVDCVQSDLQLLVAAVSSGTSPSAGRVRNSFTALVLPALFRAFGHPKCVDGAGAANNLATSALLGALLPHALKLVALYREYSAAFSLSQSDLSAQWIKWLDDIFQSVAYFLAQAVKLLLADSNPRICALLPEQLEARRHSELFDFSTLLNAPSSAAANKLDWPLQVRLALSCAVDPPNTLNSAGQSWASQYFDPLFVSFSAEMLHVDSLCAESMAPLGLVQSLAFWNDLGLLLPPTTLRKKQISDAMSANLASQFASLHELGQRPGASFQRLLSDAKKLQLSSFCVLVSGSTCRAAVRSLQVESGGLQWLQSMRSNIAGAQLLSHWIASHVLAVVALDLSGDNESEEESLSALTVITAACQSILEVSGGLAELDPLFDLSGLAGVAAGSEAAALECGCKDFLLLRLTSVVADWRRRIQVSKQKQCLLTSAARFTSNSTHSKLGSASGPRSVKALFDLLLSSYSSTHQNVAQEVIAFATASTVKDRNEASALHLLSVCTESFLVTKKPGLLTYFTESLCCGETDLWLFDIVPDTPASSHSVDIESATPNQFGLLAAKRLSCALLGAFRRVARHCDWQLLRNLVFVVLRIQHICAAAVHKHLLRAGGMSTTYCNLEELFAPTAEVLQRVAGIFAEDTTGGALLPSSCLTDRVKLLERCLDGSLLVCNVVNSVVKASSARPHGLLSSMLSDLVASISQVRAVLVAQSNAFHSHLAFCQALGVQYLCPGLKVLEESSPVVVSSVFAPQSSFALGFWLHLPTDLNNALCANAPNKSIHLVSRIFETSDANLVELLDGTSAASQKASSLCYSLNVSVVPLAGEEKAELAWCLEVSVVVVDYGTQSRATMNTSLVARQNASRVITVRSKPVVLNRWSCCVVELAQASAPHLHSEVHKKVVNETKENTTVALFVDGTLHAMREGPGGRLSLHQNVVIGKLPTRAGDSETLTDQQRDFEEHSSSSFHPTTLSRNTERNVVLADVFWVPTSVYLPTSATVDKQVQNFIERSSLHSPTAGTHHSSSLVVGADGFFSNMLPPDCSPTQLLQVSDCCNATAHRLLEVLSECLDGMSASHADGTLDDFNLVSKNIHTVCCFAADCVAVCEASAQEAAMSTIKSVMLFVAQIRDNNDLFARCCATLAASLRTLINMTRDITAPTPAVKSEADQALQLCVASARLIWLRRVVFGREGLDAHLHACDWAARLCCEDNLVLTGVAHLVAVAISHNLADRSLLAATCDAERVHLEVLALIASGGWVPSASASRLVELLPRKLFLFDDPRGLETVVFPASASVLQSTLSRSRQSGNATNHSWLTQCVAAFSRIAPLNSLPEDDESCFQHPSPRAVLMPAEANAALPSTEFVVAQDFSPRLALAAWTDNQSCRVMPAADLIDLLKQIVALPISRSKLLASAKLEFSPSGSANKNEMVNSQSSYLALAQQMMTLRCLLVQTSAQQTANGLSNAAHMPMNILHASLNNILSLALLDPVRTVSAAFATSTVKGLQLDVLRNLLREGDVGFLEKIVLRLWKQFKFDGSLTGQYGLDSGLRVEGTNGQSVIQLSSLAGDVVISDTKIRALSHFPSVRLLGVALEACTGRWYYEVTLLSDGLMQIGWANAHFQCDPVCGQGVGDHNHSWSYDGLRTKKWNVSCEPYGRRWRLGDVVGALVDTDLQEMRFFLNGEDLGPAFEDFSHYDIFPAFSLNVRQSVRLNFGQHKFLFPPDEVDGKAFRPVIAALTPKVAKPAPTASVAGASTSKSQAKLTSIVRQSSTDSGGSDGGELGSSGGRSSFMQQLSRLRATAQQSTHQETTSASSQSPRGQSVAASVIDGTNTTNAENSGASGLAAATSAAISNNDESDEHVIAAVTNRSGLETRYNGRYDYADQEEEDEEETADQLETTVGENDVYRTLNILSQEGETVTESDGKADKASEVAECKVDVLSIDKKDSAEEENEEEEEEEEEDNEEDNDILDRREDEDNDEDEEEDEEEEESQSQSGSALVELRRQAMIESLIAMGFPVDWALRASEHCDASTSESAAISWIIERMELEQSKMDEAEGDSSRVDDEDFDEAEDSGLEYFMQRHAAINGAGSAAAERLAELHHNGILSTGNSPTREEPHGIRRVAGGATIGGSSGLLLAALSGDAVSSATAGRLNNRSRTNSLNGMSLQGTGGSTSANVDGCSPLFDGELQISSSGFNVPWNNCAPIVDGCNYPPMLIGQYTARRRHDLEKQEVLRQVTDLELTELLPIIASCELALCIYYARALLARTLQVENDELHRSMLAVTESPTLPAEKVVEETALSHLVLEVDCQVFCDLLKIQFKQQAIASSSQCDRLLPLISNGNVLGDCRDRLPPLRPFLSHHTLLLHSLLAQYESAVFPEALGTFAADDASIQVIASQTAVVDLLLRYSTCCPDVNKFHEVGDNHCSGESNNAANYSSISSGLSQLEVNVLRGVGVDLSAFEGSCSPSKKPRETFQRRFQTSCKAALRAMVEDALNSLDRAAVCAELEGCGLSRANDTDWICSGLEKDDTSSIASAGDESKPAVLWAFWLLRHLLLRCFGQSSDDDEGDADGMRDEKVRPIRKLSSMKRELSSGAILWDDSASTRGSVCGMLTSAATLSRLFKILSSADGALSSNISLRFCVYELASLVLAHVNGRMRAATSALGRSDVEAGSDTSLSTPLLASIAAMDHYMVVAKETHALTMHCSKRLKTEVVEKRLFSRYLRSLSGLLYQCQLLKSGLGFHSDLRSSLHELSLSDMLLPKDAVHNPPNGETKADIPLTAMSEIDSLVVTQLSSSSISVSWSIPSLVFANTRDQKDKPALYSLWIAQVSSAWTLGSGSKDVPTQVRARLEASGSLRIEDLEADTLYRVSVLKEDAGEVRSRPELLTREPANFPGAEESGQSTRESDMLRFLARIQADQDEIFNFPAAAGEGGSGESDVTSVQTVMPFSSTAAGNLSAAANDSPTQSGSQEVVHLLVSTESEAAFRFDAEHMSPNIVASAFTTNCSSNQLTLRNHGNKKWSTARANTRMVSGVHRWDVHVDRCVSKNIFLGVATAESRLDNYVGCDRFGWAFLANKAVWHNKTKTKTYGELFRSGDTVTVLLDLDAGTLSYILNHEKHLGVAFEDIRGPVYPAFSLYNEDDQLTIAHVRSSPGSAVGVSGESGHFSVEKLLQRTSSLQQLLRFTTCHRNEVIGLETVSLSECVYAELLHRWRLWRDGVTCRSFLVANSTSGNNLEFATLQVSEAAVTRFTSHIMKLGELVLLDGDVLCRVVGVAGHRLWLQSNVTGELTGHCADSLVALIESGSLGIVSDSVLRAHYAETYHVAVNCIDVRQPPPSTCARMSFEESPDAMARAIQASELSSAWSLADDSALSVWINTVAQSVGSDPFSVSVDVWVSRIASLRSSQTTSLSAQWLGSRSTESAVLRILVLIHINDLALPLLPLLAPYSHGEQFGASSVSDEMPPNHPTNCLIAARALLFSMVKIEFAHHLTKPVAHYAGSALQLKGPRRRSNSSGDIVCGDSSVELTGLGSDHRPLASAAASATPSGLQSTLSSAFKLHSLLDSDAVLQSHPTTNNASSNNLVAAAAAAMAAGRAVAKAPVPADSSANVSVSGTALDATLYSSAQLVLEVEDERYLLTRCCAADTHSSRFDALADSRWQLLVGYQCSMVGQLVKFLEQLSCLNSCSPTGPAGSVGHLPTSNNAAAWEYALRNICGASQLPSLWSGGSPSQAPMDKPVPFRVRRAVSDEQASGGRLHNLLLLFESRNTPQTSNATDSAASGGDCSGGRMISEWQLFAVFVETACDQFTAFVDSLFACDDGSGKQRGLGECAEELNAGELSLTLQLFQATGVLLGLALRSGAPLFLRLPELCHRVLCGELGELSSVVVPRRLSVLLTTCTLALRTGLISVFSETALSLMTRTDMRCLLEGGGQLTAGSLRRRSGSQDPSSSYVQFFWAGLYELSPLQLSDFLKKVTDASEWYRQDKARVSALLLGADWLMPDGRQLRDTFRLHLQVQHHTAATEDSAQRTLLSSADLLPITAQSTASKQDGDLVVCLPCYSSFNVTLHHLLAFVKTDNKVAVQFCI